MSKKNVLFQISVYGFAHLLVDAACAAALFAINKGDPNSLYQIILVYDVLAFAPQPIFGLLVDRWKAPARIAVLGILLVAASMLIPAIPLLRGPLLFAVTAGIGNAIFHAGGGSASLDLAPGKATLPGIFVAPGALGLTVGILIGKGGGFTAWPFVLPLLASAVLILRIARTEDLAGASNPSGQQNRFNRELPESERPGSKLPADLRWFEAVIVLLLLSVAMRSLVGQSLVLPWKSDLALLLAMTSAVVLGKALGGILADRYGWTAVAVSGLVISAPLLAFFAPLPALIILGTFLFNLSMPVTLVCLAGMLPGKSGFAFGLTALALIAGALPAFLPLQALTGQPGFIFISILVSIAALYFGLRLYHRHFQARLPALQPEIQWEEK
jgi:hypothetical protein